MITPDKILFFDLDGTLIDTDYLNWVSYKEAYEYVNKKRNLEFNIAYEEATKGAKEWVNFPRPRLEDSYFEGIEKKYFLQFDYNRRINSTCFSKGDVCYYDDIISKKQEVYSKKLYLSKKIEENVSILRQHSKTNKIILVSNSSRERGLETLKYHQLDRYFHKMFFAEDKTLSDNKYENAIKYLGISSKDIIAFEDDNEEIKKAEEVGIEFINIDVYISIKNLIERYVGRYLCYKSEASRMAVKIERESFGDIPVFIDVYPKIFYKKRNDETEILDPVKGVEFEIVKGGLKEFIIRPNEFLKNIFRLFIIGIIIVMGVGIKKEK